MEKENILVDGQSATCSDLPNLPNNNTYFIFSLLMFAVRRKDC